MILLTAKQGDNRRQIVVNELQAIEALSAFIRKHESLEESSYFLRATGIINEVKTGKCKGIDYNDKTLILQLAKEIT